MTSNSEETLPCVSEGCSSPKNGALYCIKHEAEVLFEDAVVKPRRVPRDLYMRLYRSRARAQGRCYDCTKPALPGKTRCRRHFAVGLGALKRRKRDRVLRKKARPRTKKIRRRS